MDRHLSLEKLERDIWPDRDFESNLVKRCHELRKIPIDKLTIEDLRLLIGQEIGLNFLVDIAIEKLTVDTVAEGDFYPGDLLQSVLHIDTNYWTDHKDQWTEIDHLLKQNEDMLEAIKLCKTNFYRP